MKKYVLTAEAGKFIQLVEVAGGLTHIIPVNSYRLVGGKKYIQLVEISGSGSDYNIPYGDFVNGSNVSLFANAAAALTWFKANFFVEAPTGGGGGGTPGTLTIDRAQLTASGGQTAFPSGLTLSTNDAATTVTANGVELPFSRSGDTVTVSARDAGDLIRITTIKFS